MTFLWFGSELDDWDDRDAGAGTTSHTTDGFLTDATRRATGVNIGGVYGYVEAAFTPTAMGWVHGVIRYTRSSGDADILHIRTATDSVFKIYHPSSAETRVAAWDGATWVDLYTFSPGEFDPDVTTTIDIFYKAGADGFFKFHVDGAAPPVCDVVAATPVVSPDRLRIGQTDPAKANGGTIISEVIISDESTLGLRLFSSYPNEQGTYDEFTNGITEIEDANGDATVIEASSGGLRETFGTRNLSAVFQFSDIMAFAEVTRASSDNADIGTTVGFKNLLHTLTGDYEGSLVEVPGVDVIDNYRRVLETHPATGQPFSLSALNQLQFGLVSVILMTLYVDGEVMTIDGETVEF